MTEAIKESLAFIKSYHGIDLMLDTDLVGDQSYYNVTLKDPVFISREYNVLYKPDSKVRVEPNGYKRLAIFI
jgi:hypothetical protein